MRITGGSLCGRIIDCPLGVIRPAMDRMRESVFAVLGNLEGKSFLDMFSGSGICALEAASRGANPVFLVEKDPLKVDTLFRNIAIAPNRIECSFISVELFLKRGKNIFDIIYFDPPFPYRFHKSLLETVAERPILKEGGLVLMHRPRECEMPDRIRSLELIDRRTYGRSIVDFYIKNKK